ncbi:uncharacterized protein EDB91DRAFT_1088151 [Suillus paluster]|uniref:uncharacterized protein n=1 Tax=Suillus paluster TaxID=48578 RepID=UPI001B8809D6|nr:uncharacterized protein EDB91DRAFT_1088151 [Suillus paluster]KAG1722403.1 hypothetical protein EDB91DRAFT_1088151 [Suillus paluster]
MEVLWVRWFGVVPQYRWGFQEARLPKIGFIPKSPGAFGFLDPSLTTYFDTVLLLQDCQVKQMTGLHSMLICIGVGHAVQYEWSGSTTIGVSCGETSDDDEPGDVDERCDEDGCDDSVEDPDGHGEHHNITEDDDEDEDKNDDDKDENENDDDEDEDDDDRTDFR